MQGQWRLRWYAPGLLAAALAGCGPGHGANRHPVLLAPDVILGLGQIIFGLLQGVAGILLSAGCLGDGNRIFSFQHLQRRALRMFKLGGRQFGWSDAHRVLPFLQ